MIFKNLLITITIFLFAFPLSSNAQVAVIANKSINAKAIDKHVLSNLYTLQSNELGSQKLKLFFLTTENETNKIFLDVIGKSFQDLKKIWLRAKLTGNGSAPDFVTSEREMLEKVSSTPNSIGFINLKDVSDDIKVIAKLQ